MKRDKKKIICTIGIMILYCAFCVIMACHHEFWRDEAQAWCLVRDNSFLGVWQHLKAEGHPILWFAVLFPFAHLGMPIETLSVICIVFMEMAAFLLLMYAPFSIWMKLLLMFSSVMLYYNTTICRIYSLVILLLYAIAVCYKKRMEKPWRYMILIALLLQSHIIMAGLAIVLMVCYLFECLGINSAERRKENWLAMLCPLLSIMLLFMELSGGGQMSYVELAKNICSVPLNSLQRFMEQFSFGVGETIGYTLSAGQFYIILSIFFMLAVVHLKSYWREILIISGGMGGQIFIAAFIYGFIRQREIILLATMIFGYWICSIRRQEIIDIQENGKKEIFQQILEKIAVAILAVMLLLSFRPAKDAIYEDYTRSFSGAKEVAEFIIKNLPADAVIVSNASGNCSAISGYEPKIKLWDVTTKKYYSYCDLLHPEMTGRPSYIEICEAIQKKFGTTEHIYFLVDKALIPADTKGEELERLFDEEETVVADESFSIYKFR